MHRYSAASRGVMISLLGISPVLLSRLTPTLEDGDFGFWASEYLLISCFSSFFMTPDLLIYRFADLSRQGPHGEGFLDIIDALLQKAMVDNRILRIT